MTRSNKRVIVVRHAKSSWDDPRLDDHDRPLAPRGRKALRRLRRHLEQLGLRPCLVLCSSSRRTRETLDGLRPALGYDVRTDIDRRFYGADADQLLTSLRGVDDRISCVLLVGHNPGVADLVDVLVENRRRSPGDIFPTAAAAVLSFRGHWRALAPSSASLDSLWTPRHGEVATGTTADDT